MNISTHFEVANKVKFKYGWIQRQGIEPFLYKIFRYKTHGLQQSSCLYSSIFNPNTINPIFCTILRTWHEKMKLGTYCTTFIFKIFQFCPVRANVVHMTINTATWPHVASVQVFYSFPENKICMIGKKCIRVCCCAQAREEAAIKWNFPCNITKNLHKFCFWLWLI